MEKTVRQIKGTTTEQQVIYILGISKMKLSINAAEKIHDNVSKVFGKNGIVSTYEVIHHLEQQGIIHKAVGRKVKIHMWFYADEELYGLTEKGVKYFEQIR